MGDRTEAKQGREIEVLAVVVLYRLSPDESPGFRSLSWAIGRFQEPAVACIVYDNSPAMHALPATPFPCSYRHDPSNPGLATAYQFALDQAEREGIPWLLLLDQDTTVTTVYLAEVLRSIDQLREQLEYSAIVPKLVQDGVVLSPHWPHGEQSQQSFADRQGLMEPDIRVYNSGALLRVEAVRTAGGFPLDFPLDYLDHAMFARLQARKGRIFLLKTSLPHQLESKTQNIYEALSSSARLRGMLAAETRFYRQYGGSRDRLLLWGRRAKLALGMLRRGKLGSLLALIHCTL